MHNSPPKSSSRQIITLMVLFLSVGIMLAALTATFIMQAAGWIGGPIEEYLLDKGPDRVMRRCILIWGIFFLALFLKRAGWGGWRDTGLSEDPDSTISPRWRPQTLRGIIIGLLTLGSMSLGAWALGIRIITPPANWATFPRTALSYISSGITVGLLEEIICRGILFRLFARYWRVWPAAVFSSGLFALAHFLSPDPASFTGTSWAITVWQVYTDTFINAANTNAFGMRMLNLTLLGVVLCAFLTRSGSIWQSVGAHAGWVWVIKFHHYFTDFNPDLTPGIWLGSRADFTDSLLATGMMLALVMAGGLNRRPTMPLRHGDLTWHVDPARLKELRQWLTQYFKKDKNETMPFTTDNPPGNALKFYDGCRITALGGFVIKAYWPRGGWRGRRFPLRPARVPGSFETARRLTEAGIPTASPAAWSIKRRYGVRQMEYLISEELQGAEPLTDRLKRNADSPPNRAGLLQAYGALAGDMHAAGYSNRDFKHENVMTGNDDTQLWVVDLDGVRKKWRLTRRRAARDLFRVGDCLAKLDYNRPEDVQAFFKGYNSQVPAHLQRNDFP